MVYAIPCLFFIFFNSLFFMVNYIFTLTFSYVSFCFFQVTMGCLYSSYPYYFCFICCNNLYFSPSIIVNLVFNDLISKLTTHLLTYNCHCLKHLSSFVNYFPAPLLPTPLQIMWCFLFRCIF